MVSGYLRCAHGQHEKPPESWRLVPLTLRRWRQTSATPANRPGPGCCANFTRKTRLGKLSRTHGW